MKHALHSKWSGIWVEILNSLTTVSPQQLNCLTTKIMQSLQPPLWLWAALGTGTKAVPCWHMSAQYPAGVNFKLTLQCNISKIPWTLHKPNRNLYGGYNTRHYSLPYSARRASGCQLAEGPRFICCPTRATTLASCSCAIFQDCSDTLPLHSSIAKFIMEESNWRVSLQWNGATEEYHYTGRVQRKSITSLEECSGNNEVDPLRLPRFFMRIHNFL